MISLRDGKDAVQLCEMVTGKKRQPVYYVDQLDKARMNDADARELLGGHLDQLQTKLRVNRESLDEALGLVHEGHEPGDEHGAPTHRSYWELLDLRDQLNNAIAQLQGTKVRG